MEINILKSVKTPSEKEIALFERQNEIQIPEQLKNFLQKYNVIYIKENKCQTENATFFIDRFYPFLENYEISLQSVYAALKDYLTNEYLAFANDPGNWQYVISLKGENKGVVYMCRMDDVIPDSLQKVANSFNDYLALLR